MFSYHVYFKSSGYQNTKNGSFFAFFAHGSKKLVWATVSVRNLSATERPYWVLSENGTRSHYIFKLEISKKLLNQQKLLEYSIFKGWYLANGSSESNNL